MTLEEINEKKVELREEIENAETTEKLDELKEEVEALNNEIPDEVEEQPKEEEKVEEEISKEEERSLVRDTQELEVRSISNMNIKGETKMEEFRNSKEYVEAYANYIKTGEDKELRALVTTGGYATGNNAVVEVPDLVYDIVKTAWEREDLMRRVRTLAVKGNLKVQFEVSGSPAVAHQEGNGAVTEEQLVLGVVEIKPESIKKWISISDEVVDLRGEEFLRYIYDELTYRIAKKCADILVSKIASLPQSLAANSDGIYDKVSANAITTAPSVDTIAKAIANLSDEAREYTIVMNKLTYGDFKAVQYANGYAIDVFEGADVVFNNSLPSYASASANDVYAIVGDFRNGAMATYPNGDDINIKYDDITDMTKDLVRILGRRFVGIEAVADKSFVLIKKASV